MPTNTAQNRIRTLVRNGLLEKPDTFPCFMCGGNANHYHHFRGYEGADAYRVLPLCFGCHLRVTKSEHPLSPKHKRFMEVHAGHRITEHKSEGKIRPCCLTCLETRRLRRN